MSTISQELPDYELRDSQWITLSKLLEKLTLPHVEALRALKLRNLACVRPAILYIDESPSTLLTLADQWSHSCIEKVLTPHCDWHPDDKDNPGTATVDFHISAFLVWLEKTDLELPIDDLKAWQSNELPDIKKRGLLVWSPDDKPSVVNVTNNISQVVPAKIVKEAQLAAMTGYSVSALETMRRRGSVVFDKHWFKTPKGGISWNVEEFEQWQKNENPPPDILESKSKAIRSESESRLKVAGSENQRNRRRRQKG